MKKQFLNKKGITLISLVITIVITLIIATVAINFIIGNNGLFNKTNSSVEAYKRANVKEELENALAVVNCNTDKDEITNNDIIEELPKNLSDTNFSWENQDELKGIYKGYEFQIIDRKVNLLGITENTNEDKPAYDLGYTVDKLLLEYDGEINTRNGHKQNANKWEDLSGKNHDGTFSESLNDNLKWEDKSFTISNNSSTFYMDSGVQILNTNYSISFTMDGTNLYDSALFSNCDGENANGNICWSEFFSKRGIENSQAMNKDVSMSFGVNGIKEYTMTVTDSKIKVYVNGTLFKEIDNTLGLNSANTLRIFNSYYEKTNQSVDNIKMYNFRVYGKELTEDEITTNYNIDKTRFNIDIQDVTYKDYVQDGLILHLDGKTNRSTGHNNRTITWEDLSGNNNNGSLAMNPDTNEFKWNDNCLAATNGSVSGNGYVTLPITTNNMTRTLCFTIDGRNNAQGILATSDKDNFNGYFVYKSFLANRGTLYGSYDSIRYDFTKSGIYNYTLTMDNSNIKLYCNGVLVQSISNTKGLAAVNNIKLFGTYYQTEPQCATNLKFYNFKVYNKILSSTEIEQNCRVDRYRFGLSN